MDAESVSLARALHFHHIYVSHVTILLTFCWIANHKYFNH